MARLDLVLYAGLPDTGMLEYSTTSDTGPWTEVELDASMSVSDALAFWTAAIALVVSEFDLSYHAAMNRVESSCAAFVWLRLSATLADLLGFSDTVLFVEDGSPIASDLTPQGVTTVEAGQSMALARGHAVIDSFRAGRATSYHHGRVREVRVALSVPPALWADLSESCILTGHGQVVVTGDNATDWGEGEWDGVLTIDPVETPVLERGSPDDHTIVEIVGTMEQAS